MEPFPCTSVTQGDVYFEENSATIGGAIGALNSSLITDEWSVDFKLQHNL